SLARGSGSMSSRLRFGLKGFALLRLGGACLRFAHVHNRSARSRRRGARISLTRFEVVVMLRIHITMVALSVLAFGIVAGRPEVVHAQAQMPTVGAEFPIIPDGVESRAITWENPTGEKGAGGKAGGG